MLLQDGFCVSDLIRAPNQDNLNINGSKAFFFHGTRKDISQQINDQGFNVVPGRPVFTLDPIYSLGYCRKSESYLRGLISSGNVQKLKEETDRLIQNKIISNEDLEDTKYMWWINKANSYYETTADIVNEGLLLVFPWSIDDMTEALESQIVYKKIENKEFLEGAPSYWRTRQFFHNTESAFKQNSFSEIALTSEFVNISKELYSATGKGKLTQKYWDEIIKTLTLNIIRNPKQIDEGFKLSYLSQIVESRFLKELKDLLIGVLKNRNLKIYWARNNEYIEDPRWTLTADEINQKTKNLKSNSYPFVEWKNFIDDKLLLIRSLEQEMK